jgi:hypothetical protein
MIHENNYLNILQTLIHFKSTTPKKLYEIYYTIYMKLTSQL